MEQGLTRKELVEKTGCPPYLVSYYSMCGYLPVLKQSHGPGDPTFFDPSAVDVILERMARRRPQTENVNRIGI